LLAIEPLPLREPLALAEPLPLSEPLADVLFEDVLFEAVLLLLACDE
jgi:hypothetical protein